MPVAVPTLASAARSGSDREKLPIGRQRGQFDLLPGATALVLPAGAGEGRLLRRDLVALTAQFVLVPQAGQAVHQHSAVHAERRVQRHQARSLGTMVLRATRTQAQKYGQ